MADFNEKEVADELARMRRNNESGQKRDSEYVNCLHCGSVMKLWLATDPGNPICDNCLSD